MAELRWGWGVVGLPPGFPHCPPTCLASRTSLGAGAGITGKVAPFLVKGSGVGRELGLK